MSKNPNPIVVETAIHNPYKGIVLDNCAEFHDVFAYTEVVDDFC